MTHEASKRNAIPPSPTHFVTSHIRSVIEVSYLNYLKNTKLKRAPIDLGGLKTQALFTSWSWNLLGLTFAHNGLLTLYIDHCAKNGTLSNIQDSFLLTLSLRASIILFETAAPTTMLIAAVVRYGIWEQAKKNAGSHNLKKEPLFSNIMLML